MPQNKKHCQQNVDSVYRQIPVNSILCIDLLRGCVWPDVTSSMVITTPRPFITIVSLTVTTERVGSASNFDAL
jgi:hypothetical protein